MLDLLLTFLAMAIVIWLWRDQPRDDRGDAARVPGSARRGRETSDE